MRALYAGEDEDTGWVNDLNNALALSAGKKLTRTPTVTGNRRQFTIMMNIRRHKLGVLQNILSAGSSWYLSFAATDRLSLYSSAAAGGDFSPKRVFRDTEWFFLGIAYDTVARTVKMVINDQEIDDWHTSSIPNANYQSNMNAAGNTMELGAFNGASGDAEIRVSDFVLLDGEVLTPQQMIDYRTRTVPFGNNVIATTKKFDISGQHSYGVNGCQHLYEDGGDLGKSTAGNLTSWSLTGITSDDQLTDTPGDPYPVLSVLNKQATVVVSQGGTQGSYSSTGNTAMVMASVPFPESGKWYYEHTIDVVGTAPFVGLHSTRSISGYAANVLSVSSSLYNEEFAYSSNGQKHVQGVHSSYGSTFTSGDTIGVLYDADANTVEFFKENVSQGVISGLSGSYTAFGLGYAGSIYTLNVVQKPFKFSIPTGALELKSSNLPTPKYNGRDKFDVALSVGTGSPRDIYTPFDQIGLVWGKARSSAFSHRLEDRLRGAGKGLFSNTTAAEESRTDSITDFSPGGFSFGADAGSGYNQNGVSYAYWIFGNDGTEVTNTDGTIDSQVIADSSGYMSIVKYTANGVNGSTIGHGGTKKPAMIILKNLSSSASWVVYNQEDGAAYFTQLDTTGARLSGYNVFAETEPTQTVFSIGNALNDNQNTSEYVAYVIFDITGLSKVFSYQGNGGSNGTYVHCGFKPRWILLKRIDGTGNWVLHDSTRDEENPSDALINPNTSSAEASFAGLDITANGFKIRTTDAGYNTSGNTYIGLAIADVAGGGNLPAILGN